MSATFPEAYSRILKATGCARQEELAETLGIRQSFITDCHRRGEFSPEVLLALVERCSLNPHWVRTGRGQKYILPYKWPSLRERVCFRLCEKEDLELFILILVMIPIFIIVINFFVLGKLL